NLYEEMEDGSRLRAIVHSRSPQTFRTHYLGRPHHVHVKPLERLPWSVVTFVDTEMIDTYGLEVIGDAFIWAFIYLLLFVLLGGLYLLAKGGEVPRYFWPKASGGSGIEWGTATALAALPAFALAAYVAWSSRGALLAVAFAIP